MPSTYVTFGQAHTHAINGKTLDSNCVAVIACKDAEHGRELAFEYFKAKFCMEYHEDQFDMSNVATYYPRGLIEI